MKLNKIFICIVSFGALWAQEVQPLETKSTETKVAAPKVAASKTDASKPVESKTAAPKAVAQNSVAQKSVDSTQVDSTQVSTQVDSIQTVAQKVAQPATSPVKKPKPIPFKILTPPNKSLLYADTLLLTGTAPQGHLIYTRGYSTAVDTSGQWEIKMASPRGLGRYSFDVFLYQDSIEIQKLRWRIEKMDQEIAYSLDSLTQVQDVQREIYDKKTQGDIVYFIPKTDDLAFIGLNTWRNSQIVNSQDLKVKIVHPDSLELPQALKTQRECHQVYCASLLAGYNRVPYSIVGKITSNAKAYMIELSIVKSANQKVEKFFRKKVVKNRFLAMEALDDLHAQVKEYLATVITAKIVPPEDLESLKEEQAVLKRKREIDAIMGTHIIGTDLPDTLFADRSPYVVAQTMVVPAGQTTVIEKGVTFLMYGQNTEIQVFGQLNVQGSETEPVKFISHRQNPIIGDWAGIVIQSPYTSIFKHVEIEHARLGLEVVNSSVDVQNSIFSRNLIYGIHAMNSDVVVSNSEFRTGHESAILAESYSYVKLDRTQIVSNENGLTIRDFGQIEVKNSDIYRNKYGVLLLDSVSAYFANTKIRDNKIGLASSSHFKNLTDVDGEKTFDAEGYSGVRSNVDNFVHLNRDQMIQLSQQLVRKRKVKLLVSSAQKSNFKNQLVSIDEEDREYNFNHMGSVSAGLGFHSVDQPINESPRIHDLGNVKVYPGQRYPNDKQIQGFHANTSVFTLTELDSQSLEFNMDMSWDDSVGVYTNPFTIRYASPERSVVLGDMNESSHELVLSSRDIMGIKAEEYFAKNRNGDPKWKVMGLWGETQRSLDVGEHNPAAYFDEILPGNARPQEILTMGVVRHQFTPRLKVDGGIVHSKEERDNLIFFRRDIEEESVLGEPQIQAQSIFTEWDYSGKNQLWRLNVALIHASSDSIEVARSMAIDRFIEENNIIENADSLKQALQQRPSPNPALVEDFLPAEYPANAYVVIAEIDREESHIQDSLSNLTYYGFKKSIQSWGGQTILELNLGNTNIYGKAQFMGHSFYSAGSPNLNNNSRTYELSWNQGLATWWESNVKYGAYVENASSRDDQMNLFGYGEGSFFGFTPDEESKEVLDPNRVRPKYIQDINVNQVFYLPHNMDLEVGYSYQDNFQRTSRVLEKDSATSSGIFLDDRFAGNSGSIDYYGQSISIDQTQWNNYIAMSDTLASDFEDHYIQNEVSSYLRWKYNRTSSIRIGAIYGWQVDKSLFKQDENISELAFADSTWGKLGYYFGGEDFTQLSLPVTWSGHFDLLKNRMSLKYSLKNVVDANEVQNEVSVRNSTTYEVQPGVLAVTLDLGLRNKSTEKEDVGYYFVDTTASSEVELHYFTAAHPDDSSQVATPQREDSRYAQDVSSTTVASSEYELRQENVKEIREEIDFYIGTTVKYNFNSRFYTEVFLRYDEFGRPQDLNEEYTDFYTGAQVNYSF